MFATIHTISEPENFWGKIKYNLLPPPVKTEVVRVEDGSDFLNITVPVIRGKIYWNNVSAATGDAVKNLLVPRNLAEPDRVKLKVFKPEKFLSLVTINSFIKVLELLPKRRLISECAVVDFPASFTSLLSVLPKYCRTLRIITANEEKYELFSRTSLLDFGCAVNISKDISKAFDSPTVLIPAPQKHPLAFSRTSKVFAPSGEKIYAGTLLTPEGVNLPSEYLKLMPAGIDPISFGAALFERSGVSALSKCACQSFSKNNSLLSYKDVISMLDY